VRGRPNANGGLTAASSRAGRRQAFKNQGERPWPERTRQTLCLIGPDCPSPGGLAVAHMNDEWMIRRPALQSINLCDRIRIRGIGTQPVHRLGGKRNQSTGNQLIRSPCNRGWRCRKNAARRAPLRRHVSRRASHARIPSRAMARSQATRAISTDSPTSVR